MGRASTRSGLVVAADREGFARREARGTRADARGRGSRRAPWRTRRGGCGAARAGEVWASGTARVARDLNVHGGARRRAQVSRRFDQTQSIGARRSFTSSMNLRPPSVIAPRNRRASTIRPAHNPRRRDACSSRLERADGERGVHADGGERDAANLDSEVRSRARRASPPRSAPRVSSARGCSRGTTDRGGRVSAPPIPTPLRP